MRIDQGATSTLAVVAVLLSAAACAGVVYMVWIEPSRVQAQTELAKAQLQLAESNREVAVATIRLQEWLDAQERRFESSGKRVSP